jgi:hypothetical protein
MPERILTKLDKVNIIAAGVENGKNLLHGIIDIELSTVRSLRAFIKRRRGHGDQVV